MTRGDASSGPRTALTLSVLLLAVALTGCSADRPSPRTPIEPATWSLTDHELATQGTPGALRCPRGARWTDVAARGWTTDRATRAPELATPRAAIVCKIGLGEVGIEGRGRRLTRAQLASLPLERLHPARSGDYCTADGGPTWLLLARHHGRVVGVTAAGFGCRWVRLTDDVSAVDPGDSTAPGLSRGVLTGGDLSERLCRLWDVDHTQACR